MSIRPPNGYRRSDMDASLRWHDGKNEVEPPGNEGTEPMIAFLMLAEAATMPMPAFLAGCWEQRRDQDRWTEECWTDTRGGVMIGSGRAGEGDQVGHWEWMRIERGGDGSVTFYGSPKGAPAVGFKASAADGHSITFVNVSHDYPQRVRYVATAEGLDAEVSLADGSKPERWSYKRTASALQK